MEKSTVIGVALGVGAVVIGMALKGASPAALVNPAAFMIIFVGTAAALFNAFPMEQVRNFPVLVKKLFKQQELIPKSELLTLFVELSQIARREGILALESRLEDIKDPFLKNGMSMVIDGMDVDFVRDVLDADIEAMEERHRAGALVFAQAGMYAPTLGVLGAVIGLIAALGNLEDIEVLGQSIAAAFVATLLGIFTGYVLWHPFSNKLKQLSKDEVEVKRMMVEGILSLQAGDSPMAIESKLLVFIPQKVRALLKPRPEDK
ncbi:MULTISPECIES: flagellar motor stator protein MotA [Sporomusa]|uniref:Chemotaxis protein PomA n=2 Tax=Sporomusa TaxID=2375 RepID=A0ABM9W836_9FIRM|nr:MULTISPECIES: flagellar motor stator protein MotA [Sporomusa]MCM0757721.1 flagellar motor stator protein MotA [Sporomusa sphaeroides DSM 2875]OLS57652.1 chemotaxis protein PomA [Sporomusa sphaeroides DSM 2875]CVK21323.1 Chemotaxis protein PomA [Sporomusa sphaeroides DSM 2875]SCM80982.1 Motility protein A [uncultured Sporomusa sp.]HML35724.1 flagellar motor stator protein MotA [Sporomusa sphaeroides]